MTLTSFRYGFILWSVYHKPRLYYERSFTTNALSSVYLSKSELLTHFTWPPRTTVTLCLINMWIVLVFVFRVGLLVIASGEQAFLPDLLSSTNHEGCFSTTSLSKHHTFNDLGVCVRNCTVNLSESDEVTPCTNNCNASVANHVGVQFYQAKSSPLCYCFCGNEAMLRLKKASGCKSCPSDTADRFCGGEEAISLYKISDSSMTTMQRIPEAVKTSILVPRQTDKYFWYSTLSPEDEESTYSIQVSVEATTDVEPNIEWITENDELASDQESVVAVQNDVDATSLDQSNVELTTETLTTDLENNTESTENDELASDQESVVAVQNDVDATSLDQSNVELTTETLTTDLENNTESTENDELAFDQESVVAVQNDVDATSLDQSNVELTTETLTTDLENNTESTENDELASDQESVVAVQNDVDATSLDQSNVELTTETLTTDLENNTESASLTATSTRSTTYMTTKPESVTNLDNQEPSIENSDNDFDDDYYSNENGRNNNLPDSYYGDEIEPETSTETAFQPQISKRDETYLEISTETVSPLQSSQGEPWELWVVVVLSALSILATGAVIILVSFLRTRLREGESYV